MNAPCHPLFTETPLREAYLALRAAQPSLRLREMADLLQVSEAELLLESEAAVTLLRPEFAEILACLPGLGRQLSLCANGAAVHEKKRIFTRVVRDEQRLCWQGVDAGLEIALQHWAHAFAVAEPLMDGWRYSLQFFDARGGVLQKVFLLEGASVEAYRRLVQHFRAEAGARFTFHDCSRPQSVIPPKNFNRRQFLIDWASLREPGEHAELLYRHRLDPLTALRAAAPAFSSRLAPEALGQLLHQAAAEAFSLRITVANEGVSQQHLGPVARIRQVGEWLNVLDADFSLHLHLPSVGEVWSVRRPHAGGMQSGVEVFDRRGRLAAQILPLGESDAWGDLVDDLPVVACEV